MIIIIIVYGKKKSDFEFLSPLGSCCVVLRVLYMCKCGFVPFRFAFLCIRMTLNPLREYNRAENFMVTKLLRATRMCSQLSKFREGQQFGCSTN